MHAAPLDPKVYCKPWLAWILRTLPEVDLCGWKVTALPRGTPQGCSQKMDELSTFQMEYDKGTGGIKGE